MHMEKFALNLRTFRVAKGFTQGAMSAKLNIQRQTYCNYENGKRLPNIEILLAISRILEVSLDLLVADIYGPRQNFAEKTIQPPTLRRLIKDYLSLPETVRQEILDYITFQKLRLSKRTRANTSLEVDEFKN
ncbi:hypothetical protein FACS18947_5300 [Bacteroidia bacterium]|nr:hypothetical protein FACS18947_5300 [Bacteroidia bacterium]